MAKHTPGPWKTIKSRHGRGYLCVQIGADEMYTTLEMKPADARVMAAAPDMLAALKGLMPRGWDDGTMDHMPGVKAARLAIKKAERGAS